MGNFISTTPWYNYWYSYTSEELLPESDEPESPDSVRNSPGRLMALQGSSTYLAKFLGLSNKVVSKADWITALENKRAEWLNDYDLEREGPLTPIVDRERRIDFTNLVNLVYAQAMMNSQELDTDHLIAQREFTGEDGKAIFSSFWSGYVREKLLPILHDTSNDVFASEFGFIFIDVGTGELKFFGGNPNEDFTDFESAGQFGSMDGSVFREMVQGEMESDTPSGESINTAIRNYLGECKPSCRSMNIHCAASESMRQLREKNPEKFALLINDLERLDIYFDVVSAEDESKYEHAAIKYGLENGIDVDEAVSELILVGNLAWGNGSMQGVHSTHGSFARPFGLKNLKKEVERIIDSDDIGLNSIGLGSTLRIEGEGRKQTLVVSNLSSLELLFENLDRFISHHV